MLLQLLDNSRQWQPTKIIHSIQYVENIYFFLIMILGKRTGI